MLYHALKMDLHKANKNATEGIQMLNIGRGLLEAAHALASNGGDPEQIDSLQAEAAEYLSSAHTSLWDALGFSGVVKTIEEERQLHKRRKEADSE